MLFIETDKLIDFLVKHKLTFDQFGFLYLKHTTDMKNFSKYITKVRGFRAEDLIDLEKRGYIENFNAPGHDLVTNYLATPKFFKEIFVETDQAGEELWEAYPIHINIKGSKVAARSCDKEAICKLYAKKIKNNLKKHKEVLSLLDRAKRSSNIKMGIEKWVSSEQWATLAVEYSNNPNDLGFEVY